MADYTINTASNPYHGRSRKGAATPSIVYFQESTCASTLVIKLGDIVSQDTTVSTGGFRIRQAYRAGGNGANLLAIGQHIVGIAAEASTSDGSATGLSSEGSGLVQNRKIGVFAADPDTEFVGYLTSSAVSASSLIGSQKAVQYDATNHVFLIDSTNSTAALVTVTLTGVPEGTAGSTSGPMYFKFLSSNVSEAVS
jgi:hypothetical protein